MAVRVRLTRVGSKKNAMWRVVVADQRSPRDGRFIEMIGHYNPQTEPSQIVIDRERLDHWLKLGARPTETVQKLMRAENSPPVTATAPVPPPAVEPAADEGEAATAEPVATDPGADAEPPAEAETGGGAEATPEADAAGPEADAAVPDATPEADATAAAPEAEAPEAGESSETAEDSGGADADAEADGAEADAEQGSG